MKEESSLWIIVRVASERLLFELVYGINASLPICDNDLIIDEIVESAF